LSGLKTHAVTADTPFSIQSAGKTYTATGFLIAASRGLVDLDHPLRSVLPEFRVRSRWGDEELDKITFRHLLAHRSGLCHEAPVGNNYDHRPCTFEEHIASIADTWLKFPVGNRYSYSNLGMDLVAYALARLSGKPFPDFMRDELFAPLGMTSVRYEPYGDYARGHRGPWETENHRVPMLGAGGFFISARDVARFVSFHLGGCRVAKRAIIRADLLREMTTVQWPVEAQTQGFGLGLLISRDSVTGRTCHYHPGGGYGYQTIQIWMPEEDLGAVVLLNQAANGGFPAELARRALERLFAARHPAWSKSDPASYGGEDAVPVDVEALRHVEGTYRNAENARTVRVRRNALLLDGTPLQALAPTAFVTEGGDHVTFRLDPQGRPLEMQVLDMFGCTRLPVDHTPSDAPGPDRPEWQRHLDVYRIVEDGLDFYAAVVVRRGHLHVIGWMGDACLREYGPGLFFTADGDSVEFRDDTLVWGSGAVHTRAEAALRELTDLAGIDPGCRRLTVGTLMRLTDAFRVLGDAEDADAVLELNLRLHPPAVDRLLQLAEAYLGQADFEYAADLCRRALEREPDSGRAKTILAETQA
jgi:CubicO group peptidase (beta-lactamase class C family)